MKRGWLALLWLARPALALDAHWALRSVTSLLRESPVEQAFTVTLPGPLTVQGRRPVYENALDLKRDQSARFYGAQDAGAWRLEWNLLGEAHSASDPVLLGQPGPQDGRSQALQGHVEQDSLRLDGEVDQLNLRWQGERSSAVLGRQPLNLSQSFYFSPLDFFAPFGATETYRDFRPGVDALRLSAAPTAFSAVELIVVAAYRPAPAGSATPDRLDLGGQSGGGGDLLRAQANGDAWSLTFLGGRVRDQALLGGAAQFEFWGSSWGLEGRWGVSQADWLGGIPTGSAQHQAWSFSHSRQWTPSLSSRWETAVTGDLRTGAAPGLDDPSLQSAFNVSVQADPLWVLGGGPFYRNAPGEGASLSLQATAERSLSDESVLGLTLGLPFRWDAQSSSAASALQPYSFSLELRSTL